MVLLAVLSVVGWLATPSAADAEQRAADLASARELIDRNDAVPATFSAAVVATEDSRFYTHHGIDLVGIGRAGLALVRSSGDPGGSTLDQQLAKTLYPGQGVSGKAVQVVLAVKLDATWSKPQILEMYAQSVYFGHGYYGLHQAACGYFNQPPAQLGWAQASLLAGLLQAPSHYDPVSYAQLAQTRQRHVLDRLAAAKILTAGQADQIAAQPWQLTGHPARPSASCGTHDSQHR